MNTEDTNPLAKETNWKNRLRNMTGILDLEEVFKKFGIKPLLNL